MHVSKVFNHQLVGNSVKSLFQVYKCEQDCMRLLKVKIAVDKVQQFYQIVCDGGALQATTLARVNVRLYVGEDPVTYERLILLAEKRGACNI